jgi:hypothetical protein
MVQLAPQFGRVGRDHRIQPGASGPPYRFDVRSVVAMMTDGEAPRATPQDAGLASGLVNTTAQIGGALGLAVLATVSASRTSSLIAQGRPVAVALTDGYHLAFWIACGLVIAAMAVAATVLRSQPALPPASQPVPELVSPGRPTDR